MKGINSRGNVQKGFIVPKELWDDVAKDVRTKGFAVSDILRSGLQLYLDGKIKEKDIEVWRDREAAVVTTAPAPAKATSAPKKAAAAARKATPATVAARASKPKNPAPATAEGDNERSETAEEAVPAA